MEASRAFRDDGLDRAIELQRYGDALAFETHDAVERNKLQIVGTRFFTKGGKRYIDGTYPVKWKEIA